MKNAISLLILSFISQTAVAQCGPYRHHPVWPDTVGYAYVNLPECGGGDITSILWDNGSVDLLTELGVGPHSLIRFAGAIPYDTLSFSIDQNRWDFHTTPLATFLGIEFNLFGGVEPHGPPQIFDNPDCIPVADSTVIYLLQDGIPIDSLSPVLYYLTIHRWTGLPFGHTYQTYVVDHSHCGSFGYGPIITAYSCSTAQMMVGTQDAIGGNSGSITVDSLFIDPVTSLSPPQPLTGSFLLFELPDLVPVGTGQTGTSAFWEDLPPGQYHIFFAPDSICNPSDTIVTITSGLGVDENRATPMLVWPQPVQDILHWSSTGIGTIRVHDAQGRSIFEGSDTGRLDVSQIPAGLYQLQVTHGARISRATFLKR